MREKLLKRYKTLSDWQIRGFVILLFLWIASVPMTLGNVRPIPFERSLMVVNSVYIFMGVVITYVLTMFVFIRITLSKLKKYPELNPTYNVTFQIKKNDVQDMIILLEEIIELDRKENEIPENTKDTLDNIVDKLVSINSK